MTSTAQILTALQTAPFRESAPMNGSNDAPYRITYSFGGNSKPSDFNFTNVSYTGWTAYTAAEKTLVRTALDHLETVLNVKFVERATAADPDINFVQVNIANPYVGTGGWNATGDQNGNIVDWDGFVALSNSFDFETAELGIILHEIAHAMGLDHPFSNPILSGEELTTKYSIMNYDLNPDNGLWGSTLAVYDQLALQDIWGRADANTGDTTYGGGDWLIWDTKGRDVLDASSAAGPVNISLRPGAFSSIDGTDDVVIGYGVRIENAVGSAFDDVIRGNAWKNKIDAGNGDDRVLGVDGRDVLKGEGGNDTLKGGNGRDKLFGGTEADKLVGGKGADILKGNEGDDILIGGKGSDVFHFSLGDGYDVITDFNKRDDTLVLHGWADMAAIETFAEQIGEDVVIDFGDGDVLVIESTTERQVLRHLELDF